MSGRARRPPGWVVPTVARLANGALRGPYTSAVDGSEPVAAGPPVVASAIMRRRPTYALLGPLEARLDGDLVTLGGVKQRSVLALLLLRSNEVVSTSRLIDELWDGAPPETATTALHGYVSQLRKALEPDRRTGEEGAVLVTRAPGYLLRTEPGDVDLDRFDALVAAARAAAGNGDPAQASAALAEALALWRGAPLADLADEPFARDALRAARGAAKRRPRGPHRRRPGPRPARGARAGARGRRAGRAAARAAAPAS